MFIPTNKELIDKNQNFENGAHNLSRESFTFLSSLGSGSFGKVYKVSSRMTNQIYALKVLSKSQIANLKLAEQLKNEINILSRCTHENIMKLYSVFEDKGYIFLVTELANDSSLFSKLRKSKKFSESTAANYMSDIIQAIMYLHSQKPVILHRDIKPENILINNGRCKIADFGWSNIDDEFRNTFCGTPDYLAPEMINGTGHNEKLDIWTLGVLMFELLHGHPPFSPKEKPADSRMVQKIIEKNVLAGIVEFDPSISMEARQVISALLNPNGNLRPNAKDILDFEFFKRYSKTMMRNNSDANLMANFMSPRSAESELAMLRSKLKECEAKNEVLVNSNKNLNDLLESKEGMFRNMKNECEEYKNKFFKIKEDINTTIISNERLVHENNALKSQSSGSSNGLINELNRYKYDLVKSEETVQYLFKRTKVLSTKVSEFYNRYVIEQNLDQTQEFVLSYENTIAKLDAIFDNYIRFRGKSSTNKLGIFDDFSSSQPQMQSQKTFAKTRSPTRHYISQDDENMKIQSLHKNIFENENSIKTYLGSQNKK